MLLISHFLKLEDVFIIEILDRIETALYKVLSKEIIEEIVRTVGFIKRTSKFDAVHFISLFMSEKERIKM